MTVFGRRTCSGVLISAKMKTENEKLLIHTIESDMAYQGGFVRFPLIVSGQ